MTPSMCMLGPEITYGIIANFVVDDLEGPSVIGRKKFQLEPTKPTMIPSFFSNRYNMTSRYYLPSPVEPLLINAVAFKTV